MIGRYLTAILRRKRVMLLCVALFVAMLYLLSSTSTPNVRCDYGTEYRQSLRELTAKTVKVLKALSVRHFACKGTLWAIIRRNQITFPWSPDVVICALNEDTRKYDEKFFMQHFERESLQLQYDSANDDNGAERPHIRVILFERAEETPGRVIEAVDGDALQGAKMHRIGWRRRVLPPSASLREEFPASLIDILTPFRAKQEILINVPGDGLELQKYHYPDDWWRQRQPDGC